MGVRFVNTSSANSERAADIKPSVDMPHSIESSLDTQGLASEQRGLLDLIDKLQFAQLDNVKLPQIVVVGDQSAGKSSVLEALTGTPFPRDAGACTRFATEIRMRRAKETKLKVSIIPDKHRQYNEQQRLLQYGGDVTGDTPFETMMRDATELIAPRNMPGRFAAKDILVVEKSGPDMPLLTLVDLPGLVRVANRDQSEADINTIEALSDRYMKSSRTIILAVIGGNNDYVQAPILKKARQFDPRGSRTIGVLTKPDMTERIGLEEKFVDLVTNKDQENICKLGWFVLLNPGPGEQWISAEDRGRKEAEFFSRGKWATLPPHMWGVGALRQKLSTQLQRHIGKHVKTLRRQIQQALESCEGQLKEMGAGKDTIEEMRFEMGELFTNSNNLVTPAVNGNYKNPFGEKFFSRQSSPKGTPSQKLRARVRDESERFAKRFRQHGRKLTFQNNAAPPAANLPPAGAIGDRSKKEFAENEVEPLLRQIRGNELPLDSNPRAPYILFQDYSRNWPTLAQEYKDNIGVICNEFLADVIDHVWPLRMRDPLRFHFLEVKLKEIFESADLEVRRLTDDMELEIQPFDPEYEDRLRKWRADATENGGTYTEAEEVLEKMLIYYDLTARIFTRNVITQVVERHLLLGMLRLYNPIEILRMPDSTIEAIAAENKETRERRKALQLRKKAIEEARSICAGLAMRSELRAYEDDPDDDVETEDEEPRDNNNNYRQSTAPPQVYAPQQQPQKQAQQQPQSPARTSEANKRASRDERVNRRPVSPQEPTHQSNPYRHESQAPAQAQAQAQPESQSNRERDWESAYYNAPQDQPSNAPPPPPRPQKLNLGETESYYEPRLDRTDTYSQNSGRKESARHRLANAIRLGPQN